MFIAKNIFVYLLSMLALCLLIILFNYLGMNQTLNLIISSALFGIFGEFKHEVRQFEKSYDNQQAEQISLMV
ncbi:Uncharacterised protein [Acinetobacter baumannii]|nr:Uncharacterised protein [Acinetobacter baumannii]